MTWQDPWAWLGLVALALPIIIHLLGRGRSRVHRFPTLRFVDASRLLPARRTRLHDLLLLLVRLTILVAAVAALARPTAPHRVSIDHSLARAIVIDSSASMQRTTSGGERALVAARREAARLASTSEVSTVIEVASPSSAIAGAVAWLRHQSKHGELVIISDFQVGAIDSAALATIPQQLGLQLTRVAAAPIAGSQDIAQLSTSGVTTAHVTPDASTTDVVWTTSAADAKPLSITTFAGAEQGAMVAATLTAARSVGLPLSTDSAHAVAIVFPAFLGITALHQHGTVLHTPWMTTFAARLQRDPLLRSAAADSPPLPLADSSAMAIVSDTHSAWLVAIAEDSVNGHARLLLFSRAEPGTVLAAALVAAVVRVTGSESSLAELEPGRLTDAALSAWQRAPSTENATPEPAGEGASNGRWFWLLALLLLGAEWLIRARPPASQVMDDAAS